MIFLFIGHAAVQVAFKNCAPFINCITNFDGTTRDDAEDLDLVMRTRNLLEYEATNFNADIVYSNTVNNFKSFDYRANILPNTIAQPTPNNINRILKDATVAILWKYLSIFRRSLEVSLINSKVEIQK